MRPSRMLTAIVGVALAAVVAAAVLAAGACGGDKKTAPATPGTATATPPASPGPSLSDLIRPLVDGWESRSFARGEAIDWQHGIFFVDTITGEVEGLRVRQTALTPGPTPDPERGIGEQSFAGAYQIAADGKWVWTTAYPPGQSFLLRRDTGQAWAWDPNEVDLRAISTRYVLFERARGISPPDQATGQYIVTDDTLQFVSELELPPSWYRPGPLLSDEGSVAMWVVVRDESEHRLEGSLFVADITSGSSRQVHEAEIALVGKDNFQAGSFFLEEREGGFAAGVIIREDPMAPPPAYPEPADEALFDWQGTLLREQRRPPGELSPGGELRIYESWLRWFGGGGGEGGGDRWPAVTVTNWDGTPIFRVRSASLTYGDGIPPERWLPDGSGFVALVDSGEEAAPAWERVTYAIVRPNATVERLPALPSAGQRWFDHPIDRGPAPHPTDPNLIAFGHLDLLRRDTGEWISVNLANELGPAHVDPWGGAPDEMVFALPHGGHGGGGLPVLLAPFVEYPPFSSALTMEVAAGGCLNLREGPHIDAPIKTCLPDGTGVVLVDDPTGDGYETSVNASETGYWLYVQAPGERGWVNAAYLRWSTSIR